MPLRPPRDFAPPQRARASPGEPELRALWRRQEDARRERERLREWRAVQGTVRREPGGELRAREGEGALPDYLREAGALGPHARAALRERFARRFAPLHQAAGGFRLGGIEALAERIAAAVDSGQLAPSRARSLAGYLVLGAAGIPQGASRTAYELERECRQLGLAASLLEGPERRVDVATVLEECMAPEVWL